MGSTSYYLTDTYNLVLILFDLQKKITMEDNNIIIRQTTLKDLRQLTELYDRVWPEFAGYHKKKNEMDA